MHFPLSCRTSTYPGTPSVSHSMHFSTNRPGTSTSSILYYRKYMGQTEQTVYGKHYGAAHSTGKTRLRSIILPINERNSHWYIATLRVGPTQCCMEICTDVNIRNYAAEQTLTEIGNRYLSKLKLLEPPISQADKDKTKFVSPHCQRGGPTVTPVRKPKQRPPSHAPPGYQVMDTPRDGHCLFLACFEAMAHNRLPLPPA